MAKKQSNTQQSEAAIERSDCDWGYCLTGDKDALIMSGHAKLDWFEDGSRRNKSGQVVRTKHIVVDGRKVQTTTRHRSSVCDMRIFFTEHEIQERYEQEDREDSEQRRSTYQTPEEFRDLREAVIVSMVQNSLSACFSTTETRTGYRYTIDPTGAAKVLRALEAAARGLRAVQVKVEKLKNPAEDRAVRNQAASASVDTAFRRFIDLATGASAHPQS